MYFTSGSDRAFEQLMQTRPGADHFDNGEAGAPEDCGGSKYGGGKADGRNRRGKGGTRKRNKNGRGIRR